MTDEVRGLDHLEIWKVAVDFAVFVQRKIVPLLPVEEKWALAAQLRRSVQSIPANIAEGYGRYYFTENVRFCYIARGSLEETYNHLVMANRLGYLPDSQLHAIVSEVVRLRQLLHGYIAFLKRSKRGENEPGAQSLIRDVRTPYHWNDAMTDDSSEDVESEFELTNNESTNNESTKNDLPSPTDRQ